MKNAQFIPIMVVTRITLLRAHLAWQGDLGGICWEDSRDDALSPTNENHRINLHHPTAHQIECS